MMYFFKTELSLFDEDKETIFLIPNTDTLEKDELPVFSENELTAHSKFTSFLKRTKTAIVDVAYELYEAKDVVFDEMDAGDAGKFEQLLDRNKLELLDENEFCIQTRKIKFKRQKGKSLFPKIGIGAAVLLLIVGAAAKKMRSKEEPPPEPTSEITSEIVYSSESISDSLDEPPIEEVTSSVPEAAESTTEISSVQSTVQLPESTPTSTTVQSKSTSSAVSSATTSTTTRSTAQSSSVTAPTSLQVPIETASSR